MKKTLLMLLFLIANTFAQTNENLTLSLEQAKEFALKNNPNYQIQANMIKAQKGVYWSELTPEQPEVGIEREEIPLGQSFRQFAEKRAFISQSIDFPLNYYFKHRVLSAHVQREIAQLEEVKREIIYQTKGAYYHLLLQKKLLKLADKNVQLSQAFYDKAKRSYEIGESDRLTMLKARVNLGAAQQQLNVAYKDVEIATSKLIEALGIRHYGAVRQIVLTDSLPNSILTVTREQLKGSLQNHPALKKAQISQTAAVNAKRLAYGSFLPQISVSYFKQQIDNNDYWGGEIGISLPLWFTNQAGQIGQKRAEQKMADYFYIAEQLRLQQEFDQALAELEKAANEVKLFQSELLEQAEEMFRIARESYAVGEIGYLKFIDAQKLLIETQKGYLQSLYNYQIEKAHLTKLTGVQL